MTEKQKHLLKLFRELDEICKKHNLRYVMAGGTLIGVMRNEGFIPWDDDVDIYMPRDDWNKLVELSETEFPSDRAIQCVDVDRNYTNSFPRYADTDSCAIHKHQVIGDDKAGEIIDVLTLDPIPADDKEYEKYRTHMMIYSDLVNISVVFGNRWEIPASLYLKYLLSYVFLGRDKTLKKLEDIMFSYKEEECDRYAMRWGGCPFLFDKDMMFPVKYMEFEGEKVMIPQRTNDYLVWHYGDEWSYIPPHGERESHDAICIDGIDYKEFRKDYMGKVKPGRARFNAAIRKFYYMATAKRTHRLQHERDLLMAKSTVMDLKARIKACGRDLKELVKNHEFSVLDEIFSNYYQVQLSAGFIGREDFANIYPFYHPTLLEVEDEVFMAGMMTLFYTERISKAYRMFQVREKLDHVTPEMKQVMADVVLFRKGTCHYEQKEKKEAEEICKELLERYPGNPSFLKFMCRLVMDRAREQQRITEAEVFLDKALELFESDGYFLKYKADLFWMKGKREDALLLYAEAREKTNNGIVHLELDKLLEQEKDRSMKYGQDLIAAGHKEEARYWMELWERLLPEDEVVHQYVCLTKAAVVRTQAEAEAIIEEIREKLEDSENGPQRRLRKNEDLYMETLTKAFRRLGYPKELAQLRAELLYTEDESELEWLAQEIRGYQIHKEKRAEVYKLLGDVRRKQGQTEQAFMHYREALDHARPSYVKTELSRIFLTDLYRGGRRVSAYATKGDASEFLDLWLEKYGTIEELKGLIEKLN